MIETEAWLWKNDASPLALMKGVKQIRVLEAGEVLIENSAAGINPVDWKLIQGLSDSWTSGQIPGVDGTGKIVATGPGVNHLSVGTRVMYHADLRYDGSFSRHTIVGAHAVMAVPDSISNAAAAALPCPGLTAWQAVKKVHTLSGKNVLVNGAGGAVGSMIAQLLVSAGARVYVTANPLHHSSLISRGVVQAFDYKDVRWQEKLVRTLGGQALYAAFDTVSGESAVSLTGLLGYYGHLICIQDRPETAPLAAFTTCISLHEVALAAIHQWGNQLQWSELCRAGEYLLNEVSCSGLQLPAIEQVSFDDIPGTLQLLKDEGNRVKYVAIF